MKKLFIIILILIAILAIGLGVYFAWSKSREILTPPSVSVPVQGQNNSNQATQSANKLNAISDNKAGGYWAYHSPSSTVIYYFDSTGQIFKIKDGEDEKILNAPLGEIKSVVSDKDGKKVALELPGNKFIILTIGDSGVIQESLSAVAVAFSPDSDKMAYMDNSGNISIADYSASLRSLKTSKLITINFNDPVLEWVSGNKLLLTSRPSAFYISDSWLIDISKKTIAPFGSARGLSFNWSQDGTEAVRLAVDSNFNPSLAFMDSAGLIKAAFDFSSLPDKCFITPAKIYCAISQPDNSIGQVVLPDDYLKRKVYFNDWIYEINRQDNNLGVIYSSDANAIDVQNLTAVGSDIFFINRYDNRVYELKLL